MRDAPAEDDSVDRRRQHEVRVASPRTARSRAANSIWITREELMNCRSALALATLTLLASAAFVPTIAADVTPERLANVDKEPQNWLMNHRSYDSQRYSPLDKINTGNVKS